LTTEDARVSNLRAQVMALLKQGRLMDTRGLCEQILAMQPQDAMALCILGSIFAGLGAPADAVPLLQRAVAADGTNHLAHHQLAMVFMELRRHDDALRSFDSALSLKPDFAPALLHRGYALRALERPEEALASFSALVRLDPALAQALCAKADALQDLQRPEEALCSYDDAIRRRPDYAQAHYNKGLCLLQLGRYGEGWPLTEWRKRLSNPLGSRAFHAPLWLGRETLEQRSILIHWEQGLGDTLQFCRYVDMLKGRAGQVFLLVQRNLRALMRLSWRGITVVSDDDLPIEADLHCPLMSLPVALGTTEDTMPKSVPYLRADPARVEFWRRRLGSHGFKLGLCWQGQPGLVDVGRSLPLAAMGPLAGIRGVRLISLQKGLGLEQLHSLAPTMPVEIPDPPLDGGPDAFLDTAAIMESLDLIVTSDTSIAHLAGALGRPTWLALKRVPDWRWMLEREDSPWYPTLQLFRQRKAGAWDAVFAAMAHELAGRLAIRG
jgi:Tfp pilus assembly protein PilF